MATLQDLCKDVPLSVQKAVRQCEIRRRQMSVYQKRMDVLREERNVFYNCQTHRPQKGKYRNRVWAEQCGSTGSYVATVHTQNSYIHVAVKAKKY